MKAQVKALENGHIFGIVLTSLIASALKQKALPSQRPPQIDMRKLKTI